MAFQSLDQSLLLKLSRFSDDFSYQPEIKPNGAFTLHFTQKSGKAPLTRREFFDKSTLDFHPDKNLTRVATKKSIWGRHDYYFQTYNGKPVMNCYFFVHSTPAGEVTTVQARAHHQNISLNSQVSDTHKLRKRAALVYARKLIKKGELLNFQRVYYPIKNELIAAYKFIFFDLSPLAEWELVLDNRGRQLSKINLIKLGGAKRPKVHGLVFFPNPVIALRNFNLKDHGDENFAELEGAYKRVTLKGLKEKSYLSGSFVDLLTSPREMTAKNSYFFKRNQEGFEEVMIYYHLDRAQRAIQKLGFKKILNRPQKVEPHATTEDNSWYSPTKKLLSFGSGGVDDAEDADIILHEYGHAIQDDIIPGFGRSHEASSIGEGFGDYFAATLNQVGEPQLDVLIGEWDAVPYSKENPPCLRKVKNQKVYPMDMAFESHEDGEIWSSALWSLQQKVGREICMTMVLESHYFYTPDVSFKEAARAILKADENLYQSANRAAIIEAFAEKGIFTEDRDSVTFYRFNTLHNQPGVH